MLRQQRRCGPEAGNSPSCSGDPAPSPASTHRSGGGGCATQGAEQQQQQQQQQQQPAAQQAPRKAEGALGEQSLACWPRLPWLGEEEQRRRWQQQAEALAHVATAAVGAGCAPQEAPLVQRAGLELSAVSDTLGLSERLGLNHAAHTSGEGRATPHHHHHHHHQQQQQPSERDGREDPNTAGDNTSPIGQLLLLAQRSAAVQPGRAPPQSLASAPPANLLSLASLPPAPLQLPCQPAASAATAQLHAPSHLPSMLAALMQGAPPPLHQLQLDGTAAALPQPQQHLSAIFAAAMGGEAAAPAQPPASTRGMPPLQQGPPPDLLTATLQQARLRLQALSQSLRAAADPPQPDWQQAAAAAAAAAQQSRPVRPLPQRPGVQQGNPDGFLMMLVQQLAAQAQGGPAHASAAAPLPASNAFAPCSPSFTFC